ncbi:MAG: hypothetical protein ACREEB_18430 [Caulobacteraceae bacterium]
MIMQLSRWAWRFDEFLQNRLGRPYNVLLVIGLVAEIVGRARHIPQLVASVPNELRLVLLIIVELALLIHQAGYISHHFERRRAAAAKARGTPPAEG